MVVKLILEPVYRGVSERIDVIVHLEGRLDTQYELSEFIKHLQAAAPLLPTDTNPDA